MRRLAEITEVGGGASVVASADEAGLIESLERPAPAEEHATRLGLDPEATRLVLGALTALGIARVSDGSFRASEGLEAAMADSLAGSGPTDELWGHLPRFLRTGERYTEMDGSADERAGAYREVVGSLGLLFEAAAQELAAKLPPPGERILDVGAGSGVWSLATCERSPATHVTALDLPDVLPAFEERAARFGLADRSDSIAGDYWTVELPAGRFDRVVLANVLHLEPAGRARALVARVAPTLTRGGELVVIDALAEGDGTGDRARSIYSLHLAMRTRHGRVHPRAEIEGWCTEAGLSGGKLVSCDASPVGIAALVHRAP